MRGDTDKAIEFLTRWNSEKWIITAIRPDRKAVESKTFYADKKPDVEDMRAFIEKWNGERNLYFTINETIGQPRQNPRLEDLYSLVTLHVDLDPREGFDVDEERGRILRLFSSGLPKGIPKPSVVVFSGGGYQAYWRLTKPEIIDGDKEKAEDLKLYNKQIEAIFGGDHCHNINRIMRVPGTVNVPDAKKIAKGREPRLAEVIYFDDVRYDLSLFTKQPKVQNEKKSTIGGGADDIVIEGEFPHQEDTEYLNEWAVTDRVKVIVVQGRDPENPKERDNSRSAWLFDVVCQLIRADVPIEVIYSTITNPNFGISESVLEHTRPDWYAKRQIQKALEYAIDPHLVEMNERHAIIGNVGGRCRVIEEVYDEAMDRHIITFSSFEDLRNRYMHRMVQVGVNQKGEPIMKKLGDWWLQHHKRRQYGRVLFQPGKTTNEDYNLWRGFAFVPKPGDWSLFREHLFENVCRGQQELYDYVIGWMARTVQMPASPGEVAIVLKGTRGTGKSKVATTFGRLFGRHMMHVSNASHLVGNFNAHLRDCLLLFADEAFFAGDKKHESVLKTIVTETTIQIEGKGVDVQTHPNYIHLMMASNSSWVVPAGPDERRYLVLEVGEERKQDHAYFASIDEQMAEGGYEGMLYDLLHMDLSGYNVRKVPQTEALMDQKRRSLGPVEEWWYRRLVEGRTLPFHDSWEDSVPCNQMFSVFSDYLKRWNIGARGMNETIFGRDLHGVVNLEKKQLRMSVEVEGPDGRPIKEKKRIYCYCFPSLVEARAQWERKYGREDWIVDELPEQDATPF